MKLSNYFSKDLWLSTCDLIQNRTQKEGNKIIIIPYKMVNIPGKGLSKVSI